MPIFAAIATALPSLISTGAGVAGNIISSGNTSKAISDASQAQQGAAQEGIDLIGRNQGVTGQLFSPYLNTGNAALSQLSALLGLGTPQQAPGVAASSQAQSAPNYAAYVQNNPDLLQAYQSQTGLARGKSMEQFGQEHWQGYGQGESRSYTPYGSAADQAAQAAPQSSAPSADAATLQQQAIDQLKNSPLFQSLYNTGKDGILANAAATGGLRGGNTENSLARFGGDTLAQVIQNQVANLGGLANSGQSAAGSVGNSNSASTSAISNLLQQQGAAQAGGILGTTQADNAGLKSLTSGIGSLLGNGTSGQIGQLLSQLGLGGTGVSAPTQLGGPSISGQNVAPLALNSNLPSLSF